ncbi:MAG: glycoside hydrolase family 99-like domain-containing protein [Casimicrobiaceae bacterium]|nr:glycoside hydrolase family 99-like domain-containing protein [Casimicrobiaceae bacterium]MDW8311628.1 glycoside hydrolase family 99-like domain-containing protein [Burkholderiales bacterium]
MRAEPPAARPAVRAYALYFPQFHAIPENDAWWGPGFTDWHNVRRAKPLFPGHYQPRVPLGGNYYDQSRRETLAWQIDLAKRHGLSGFCHYHYWFEGKQLLNTPTDMVLADRSLDFPIALAWANETWSRRWDGQDHLILIQQTHRRDPAMWMRHFEYLFRFWSDPRAITIEGRPVFMIYRPHYIPDLEEMFDLWRNEAIRRGLKGLYLVAIKQYEFPRPELIRHFDAIMQFAPFEAMYSPTYRGPKGLEQERWLQPLRRLPEAWQRRLRRWKDTLYPQRTEYDYESLWAHLITRPTRELDRPSMPGAFIDWDNTARYGKRARLFLGASPERFRYWFGRLVERVAFRPEPENIIWINAWNEWAESTYLEPDERYGYAYIEAVRDALASVSASKTRHVQQVALAL